MGALAVPGEQEDNGRQGPDRREQDRLEDYRMYAAISAARRRRSIRRYGRSVDMSWKRTIPAESSSELWSRKLEIQMLY